MSIFINMKLYDLINEEKFTFNEKGDLYDKEGLLIELIDENNSVVGRTTLYSPYFGGVIDNEYYDLYKKNENLNTDNSLYLFDLFVEPNNRNKGCAGKIIDKCKNIVKDNNHQYLCLISDISNLPAKSLYEKHSFNVDYEDDEKIFYTHKII